MINNDTYLISFETGTCGVFIKTMLEQIIAQDHPAYQEVLEFPNSHAHDVNFFKRPLMDDHFYTFVASEYEGEINSYQSAISVNHDKPLIYRDHMVPNWDLLFSKFSNSKNIVITFSEDMVEYVATFRYHKYESQFEWAKETDMWKWHIDKFPFSYKYPLVKPKQYEDRIIEIRFKDILFNKEKVLNVLANITNRSIPNFVNESYDNYLNAQQKSYSWLFKNYA